MSRKPNNKNLHGNLWKLYIPTSGLRSQEESPESAGGNPQPAIRANSVEDGK